MKPTNDGGFTIAGQTQGSSNNANLWLIKTDSEGNDEYSLTMDDGQYNEYYHEVHQLNAQHDITAGLLGSDAYLMKFIIPWWPVDVWETFYYVFIEQMMMNQLPINLIYDIDYDGNLDVMDILIAADVMSESIDTPYDCIESWYC